MRLSETELTDLHGLLRKALEDETIGDRYVLGARGKRTKTKQRAMILGAIVAVDAEMQDREESYEALNDYADVADELTDPDTSLDDLGDTYVRMAKAAAKEHGLPWPPTPAWEDDVRDATRRLDKVQSGFGRY